MGDVREWGCRLVVSKQVRADPAVDIQLFLDSQFRHSMPRGSMLLESPTWTWVDVDALPLLSDDDLKNAWIAYGMANIAVGDE